MERPPWIVNSAIPPPLADNYDMAMVSFETALLATSAFATIVSLDLDMNDER